MPDPHRSLADRAARHFPSQACVAGFKLLHDGRVALARVTASSARATVRGKRARSVRIRADEGTLWVACTCWPTSVDACACKHVWASLLALDRDAAIAAPGTGVLRLASLPDESEEEDAAPAPEQTAKAAKAAKAARPARCASDGKPAKPRRAAGGGAPAAARGRARVR